MRISNIGNFASRRNSSQTDSIYLDPSFFDHVLVAKICLFRAKPLNDVERDFLLNVQLIRKPSPKQSAWLELLAKKARLDWRAPT
jgi:hypothetical protein